MFLLWNNLFSPSVSWSRISINVLFMEDQKWRWLTDKERVTNSTMGNSSKNSHFKGVKYFKYFSELEKSVWSNLSSGASKRPRHFPYLLKKKVFFFSVWSAWATTLSLGSGHEKVNERRKRREEGRWRGMEVEEQLDSLLLDCISGFTDTRQDSQISISHDCLGFSSVTLYIYKAEFTETAVCLLIHAIIILFPNLQRSRFCNSGMLSMFFSKGLGLSPKIRNANMNSFVISSKRV